MNSIATKTVRDLAVEIPGATRVFENMGIDYCCGGKRSISDACAAVGISLEEVEKSLATADRVQSELEEPSFATAKLAKLIDHIVEKHHVFTRTEMTRLKALLDKVCSVHGQNHQELAKIRSLFQALCEELEPHMMKEERVLFPFIVGMENAVHSSRPIQVPPFGTVANPIRMMMMEHESAGELLKQMRQASSDYVVPPDGCISYQTLYQALDYLEKDLHQHIHLENNILFPRSVEMENGFKS
jgi:regulator of cell morphogenesis and NO signaling